MHTHLQSKFSFARPRAWFGIVALACLLWASYVPFSTQAHSGDSDHELARQALQQGKVLPLRTVLDMVEREHQGQVVKVEFEHDDGRFIYEMRLLHPDGQMSKLEVDAVNGRTLSIRRRGHH